MAPQIKREVNGGIFESCDICLENTPTSHAVSLALFVYACSDSALLSLSCACLSEAHSICILNLLGNLYPANNYPLHGHCVKRSHNEHVGVLSCLIYFSAQGY